MRSTTGCAYCGCEIDYKDMQVDHIKPKCRNNETTALKYGMLTEMEWDGKFYFERLK